MHAVNQYGQKILAALVADLHIGEGRKVDTRPGTFMAVHVDRIGENLYAIAHYYEQNGDLMADPSMSFYLQPQTGKFYPTDYRQDGLGLNQNSVDFDERGVPVRFKRRLQREHAIFAGGWMANIARQQDLKSGLGATLPTPPEEGTRCSL